MDITAIVTELKKERDRLNRAIAALEGTDVVKPAQERVLLRRWSFGKARKVAMSLRKAESGYRK